MRGCVIATGWLALIATSPAQTGRVSLTGTVTQPSGAVVADAPMQVKNKATGTIAQTSSKSDGRYTFAGLAPGVYDLSIVMPCCAYATFAKEVTVQAGQATALDIRLTETVNGTTLGDDPGRLAALMRKRDKVPSRPAPRTAGGKPDLSGIWVDNGDPYPERAELLPWAAAIAKARGESLGKDHPHNHCLPGSPPLPGSSVPFIGKFVQTPSLLVLLFEDVPGVRQIFLDGREHPSNFDPTWMGHSVGKWEGDTLMVDTVGFSDRVWIGPGQGLYPHTDMLRMTERYRRVDFGHMEVAVTFDDPGTFVKPLNVHLKWNLAPQEELLEYVCENNKPEHLVGK
jgi:hypothetical protein